MTNGTNIPKEEEKRLLEELSNGSELAFTRLFDRYRPRVYSVALKMLKSTDLAEEVVQEVFLKIWQKREEQSGSQPKDCTWEEKNNSQGRSNLRPVAVDGFGVLVAPSKRVPGSHNRSDARCSPEA